MVSCPPVSGAGCAAVAVPGGAAGSDGCFERSASSRRATMPFHDEVGHHICHETNLCNPRVPGWPAGCDMPWAGSRRRGCANGAYFLAGVPIGSSFGWVARETTMLP